MGISKKMQLEEIDRISREEYDEDGQAKNLDELVDVVESIQKKIKKKEDK